MANVLHSVATGIHPGAYHQTTAPTSPADGILWVDTSSGPPYQMNVWKASASAWQAVGIVTLSPGSGAGFFQLATTTLGATTASVTLTPPASSATHLMLRLQARGDNAAANVNLNMRINGDTGANYDQTFENCTSVLGITQLAAQTLFTVGILSAAGAPASRASAGEVSVFYYQGTSFFKQFSSRIVASTSAVAGGQREDRGAGTWRNTAAVTSVTLLPSAGNFISGSSFTLYGLA